jgi:transcription termination factor Rho
VEEMIIDRKLQKRQIEGTELLLQRLGKTKTNEQFLASIAKAMEAKKS